MFSAAVSNNEVNDGRHIQVGGITIAVAQFAPIFNLILSIPFQTVQPDNNNNTPLMHSVGGIWVEYKHEKEARR